MQGLEKENLCVLFEATLSHDLETRNTATKTVEEIQDKKGYAELLLDISCDKDLDIDISKAAALNFKRLSEMSIGRGYIQRATQNFHVEDYKNELLRAIFACDHRIRFILGDAFSCAIVVLFPEKWPDLVPQLEYSLKSSEDIETYVTALYISKKLVKNFQIMTGEAAGPLDTILVSLFPMMYDCLESIAKNGTGSEAEGVAAKYIFKMLSYSTHVQIRPYLLDFNRFTTWARVSFHLLVLDFEGIYEKSRRSEVWWKVKTVIMQWFFRVFQRHGDPNKASLEENIQFASLFRETIAEALVERSLFILSIWNVRSSTACIPSDLVRYCLSILRISVRIGTCWIIIKENIPFLLVNVIVGAFKFTSEDLELYQEDPVEFSRRRSDIQSLSFTIKSASASLFTSLVETRKQVLDVFFSFLADYFGDIERSATNKLEEFEIDGVLIALGTISKHIPFNSEYFEYVNNIFHKVVYGLFESQYGFLRARACWIYSKFAESVSDEELALKVLSCIGDNDIPVRVEAISAIPSISQADDRILNNFILKNQMQVLETMFELVNEVGNENLLTCLQYVIDALGSEVVPTARFILQRLAESFINMMDQYEREGEQTAIFAASECCRSIEALYNSVAANEDCVQSLTEEALFLLRDIVRSKFCSFDIMDEAMSLIQIIFSYTREYSDDLWDFFWELMDIAHTNMAMDYVKEFVILGNTVLNKNIDIFNDNVEFILRIYAYIEKNIGEENNSENNCQHAIRLLCSVILHLKSNHLWKNATNLSQIFSCGTEKNYPIIKRFISLVEGRLQTATTLSLKIFLLDVYAASLHVSPEIVVEYMTERGLLDSFVLFWRNVPELYFDYDLKILLLGNLGLLKVLYATHSGNINSGRSLITLETCIGLMYNIVNKIQQATKKKSGLHSLISTPVDDSVERTVEYYDGDINRDTNLEEDSLLCIDWGSLSDDSAEDVLPSPLDDISEVLSFAKTWRELSSKEYFDGVLEEMSEATREKLQVVISYLDMKVHMLSDDQGE